MESKEHHQTGKQEIVTASDAWKIVEDRRVTVSRPPRHGSHTRYSIPYIPAHSDGKQRQWNKSCRMALPTKWHPTYRFLWKDLSPRNCKSLLGNAQREKLWGLGWWPLVFEFICMPKRKLLPALWFLLWKKVCRFPEGKFESPENNWISR